MAGDGAPLSRLELGAGDGLFGYTGSRSCCATTSREGIFVSTTNDDASPDFRA